MIRKRGAPTLVELMQGQAADVPLSSEVASSARRASGVDAPPKAGTRFVESKPGGMGMRTAPPMRASMTAGTSTDSPFGQASRYIRSVTDGSRVIWFVVAGAIILITLVWALAYSTGRSTGRREMASSLPKEAAPGVTPPPTAPQDDVPVRLRPEPQNPPVAPPPVVPRSEPPPSPRVLPPAPVPAPATGGREVQKGLNYLVAAISTAPDAADAAAYLNKHGVSAVVVPGSGAANHMVVVSEKGYTRDQYRDSAFDAERAALVERVKKLGRQWKAENRRAPTDFAQAYWARQ